MAWQGITLPLLSPSFRSRFLWSPSHLQVETKTERASGRLLRILAALPFEFKTAARIVTKFITFQKVRNQRIVRRHAEKTAGRMPRAMSEHKP